MIKLEEKILSISDTQDYIRPELQQLTNIKKERLTLQFTHNDIQRNLYILAGIIMQTLIESYLNNFIFLETINYSDLQDETQWNFFTKKGSGYEFDIAGFESGQYIITKKRGIKQKRYYIYHKKYNIIIEKSFLCFDEKIKCYKGKEITRKKGIYSSNAYLLESELLEYVKSYFSHRNINI